MSVDVGDPAHPAVAKLSGTNWMLFRFAIVMLVEVVFPVFVVPLNVCCWLQVFALEVETFEVP